MNRFVFSVALTAIAVVAIASPPQQSESDSATQPNLDTASTSQIEFFERKVRPLLVEHCYECHSSEAETVHAGLRLDSSTAIQQGGDTGPVVVAGRPNDSLLIAAVRYQDGFEMPPRGQLSAPQIAILEQWIRDRAVFPDSDSVAAHRDGSDFDAGREFWSFQPVHRQPLPAVANSEWPQQRLDYFVAAQHDRQGLTPSPSANKTTLVRRLYYSLVGLPPTPEQVQAFVNDPSEDAYRRLVDQLLQSPQFGERWGRWWLDMARYTDRTANWLYPTGQAYLYRDWVVDALNQDMPYDQFIKRQLATDLMPDTEAYDLPALGFLSLSPTYWKELKLPCEIIKTIVADEWEERVDAVSRTFLGLTVACARCHDHKFDPISSADYYAMAGIFASCRQIEKPMMSADQFEPIRKARQRVAEIEKEITAIGKVQDADQSRIKALTADIESIKAGTPGYDTPMVTALSEESMYVVRAGETAQDGTRLEYRPEPRDLPLFVRGNPNRPGPVVPRRFLTVLSQSDEPYQQGSGRLELAESITNDAAALAARVIVNRVWLAYFGQGLVSTPSNFGTQGGRPSHPELLDDLAAALIENNWSLKQLHREILLSATWQQASADRDSQRAIDPDNRSLWRMNRQRLDFEAWRDAMLSASGELDSHLGGPSIELDQNDNHRRTIYATIHRRDMSPTLMVHDFPDPTQHSPSRTPTVTALQGLFALNGPLLLDQAAAISSRILDESNDDDEQRINRVYGLLFSRQPTTQERHAGVRFLSGADADAHARRWQQYVHVLLISNEFMFID